MNVKKKGKSYQAQKFTMCLVLELPSKDTQYCDLLSPSSELERWEHVIPPPKMSQASLLPSSMRGRAVALQLLRKPPPWNVLKFA